jgi:hypothetical protein
MRFVYILEDDLKFQKEIVEAIASVDPKIQVRIFPKLETFVEWVRHMMKTGPTAIAEGGMIPTFTTPVPVPENEVHSLALIVSKVEFLGVTHLDLIRRTKNLFIERKICTTEDPTSFVLTAFDNPEFNRKQFENKVLTNVIFKPFDRLILTQHLTFAIDGRHPPSKYTVTNQKTTALVELLKDVELESISDVGIVTRSDRAIEPGAVAKYYGKAFMSNRQRSLFAICKECIKHPTVPDSFRCSFTFFSADQTQITNLRRRTRDKSAKEFNYNWNPKTPAKSSEFNVILLDEEEASPSGLQGMIEKAFSMSSVTCYNNFGAFLSDLDPGKALDQRDSSLKALGGANSVVLTFDMSGTTYLSFESDKKDLSTLFGMPLAELKSRTNWLANSMAPDSREKYRKYVQTGGLGPENILAVTFNEVPFVIRVMDVKKEATKFHITLVEPSKAEQIAYFQKNTKVQKPIHLIVANHRLFGSGSLERWTEIKQNLKKKFNVDVMIVATTKKDFSDAEEKNLAEIVKDIFFKPVDRVYFLQKIKCLFPHLSDKSEPIVIRGIVHSETIKSVNPVTVTEISEAGFVMKYNRPITIGSFREIVLWQPYEIGAPELLATCNFVEESESEKGTFKCHFVFFGINDYFLKVIRVWIRDNYILTKESQG